jgi:hypothetical protein
MRRSRCRTLLVALAAVFAVGALASASASAAFPEFTLPHKLEKPIPVAFTAVSNGKVIFQWGPNAVECESSSMSGEIINEKEVAKIVIKFTHICATVNFCRQSGHEGYWETKELKGRIAYVNKAAKEIGLLLEPVAQPFAKCNLSGGLGFETFQGSIIGHIYQETPAHFGLAYAQSRGKQGLTKFEGEEAVHQLEGVHAGGAAEKVGEEGGYKITTAAGEYLPVELRG